MATDIGAFRLQELSVPPTGDGTLQIPPQEHVRVAPEVAPALIHRLRVEVDATGLIAAHAKWSTQTASRRESLSIQDLLWHIWGVVLRTKPEGGDLAWHTPRTNLLQAAGPRAQLTADTVSGTADFVAAAGTIADSLDPDLRSGHYTALGVGSLKLRPLEMDGQFSLCVTVRLCLAFDALKLDTSAAERLLALAMQIIEDPELLCLY